MTASVNIAVLIPAYNEENAVGKVIAALPKALVTNIVVVNNNSNDQTAVVARAAGAVVVDEPRQGYGFACLKGMAYLKTLAQTPDIVVFIDADYSDHPEELPQLVAPILERDVAMVIGSQKSADL